MCSWKIVPGRAGPAASRFLLWILPMLLSKQISVCFTWALRIKPQHPRRSTWSSCFCHTHHSCSLKYYGCCSGGLCSSDFILCCQQPLPFQIYPLCSPPVWIKGLCAGVSWKPGNGLLTLWWTIRLEKPGVPCIIGVNTRFLIHDWCRGISSCRRHCFFIFKGKP